MDLTSLGWDSQFHLKCGYWSGCLAWSASRSWRTARPPCRSNFRAYDQTFRNYVWESGFVKRIKLSCIHKPDAVGLVYNEPSLLYKEKKIVTWQVLPDMWHMVGGEHSLKMSAPWHFRFGIDSAMMIFSQRMTYSINKLMNDTDVSRTLLD